MKKINMLLVFRWGQNTRRRGTEVYNLGLQSEVFVCVWLHTAQEYEKANLSYLKRFPCQKQSAAEVAS